MARKFLYIFAGLIVLVLAGMLVLRIWGNELTQLALVPPDKFEPQKPLSDETYASADMWLARPGLGDKDAAQVQPRTMPKGALLNAAVFVIHPTTYLARDHWNAPLDDKEANDRAALFVRVTASPFNGSAQVWAPRYRQAAFGAFLTDKPDAAQALELAYADIVQAFDQFLAQTPPDLPIILAGHSQGAFHLKRLLKDRVASKPLARRIAAVYAVGWPLSLEHDLPATGLPACSAADQPGCVMSWMSFAEPADTSMVLEGYARRNALDGKSPGGSAFACTNPLTGAPGAAPASLNLGTVVSQGEGKDPELRKAMVPARCGKDGFLYIGEAPEMGEFVLPGNNYHVYDYMLFWANIRADAERRTAAWRKAR